MNLSNLGLQIISKYLDFKDVEKLLKLNPDLKYYYHTTFNLINIPIYYIIPIHQVKQIVDNLLSTFPNLEEIVLCFNVKHIFYWQFEIMIANYNNFIKVLHLKFINDSSHRIFRLKIDNLYKNSYFIFKADDIVNNTFKLLLYLMSNIFVNQIFINVSAANTDEFNKIFNIIKCNPKINFNISLYIRDINVIDNKSLNNLCFSLIGKRDLIFKNMLEYNNMYIKNYVNKLENNFIINIDDFNIYYNIIKLKNRLKNITNENIEIHYFDLNHNNCTIEDLKNMMNNRYINTIYHNIHNAKISHIIISNNTNESIFYVNEKYIAQIESNIVITKNIVNNKIQISNSNMYEISQFFNTNTLAHNYDYYNLVNNIKKYFKIKCNYCN